MAQKRTWKKQVTNLTKGTVIQGKWHHHRYEILGKLGEGAIGTVYLTRTPQGMAALKISDKKTSITMEVNVLKALKQERGTYLGPALLDVDDWLSPNGTIFSFYVMEYIRGERVDRFIKNNGPAVISRLLFQLLDDLEDLHKAGWVFGDLKLDNLIVHTSPFRIRWVDVGGTTLQGRAIKEYTELYDRGYWGLGSRKAEPSYDLFSLAMIFILIYRPHLKRPPTFNNKFLLKEIDKIKPLSPFSNPLKTAILGRYNRASEMKDDLQRMRGPQQKDRVADSSSLKEAGWVFILSVFYFLLSLLVM